MGLNVLNLIPIASHDASEKQRAQAALCENEVRLRIAIEASQLSLWDWNIETNELFWTDHTKALCGLPAESPVSYETFLASIHPEDRDRVSLAVSRALEPAAEGHYQVEYRAIGIQDGIERWVAVWGQAFFDECGKPYRFLGMGMDLTERKRTELALLRLTEQLSSKNEEVKLAKERVEEINDKLKHTVDELQRSNEDLDRFASVVAHDLKQPIQMVSLVSDLLIRRFSEKLDEKGIGLLDQVRKGSARMGQLVDTLAKYARVQQGHVQFTTVDVAEVIRLAVESLWARMQETGATIELGEFPSVAGEPVRLGELFQNLLSNALKYRRPGVPPRVSVRCVAHPTELEFVVEDNGIGIEKKDSDAIFGMFTRLHSAEAYEGSGVGLAICKKIVDLHGGRIWVESTLGRGSRFHFTLSRQPAG